MPHKFAAEILSELDNLEQESPIEDGVILKESRVGAVVSTAIGDARSIITWTVNPNYTLAFDNEGFSIFSRNYNPLLSEAPLIEHFRSKHFIQRRITSCKYRFQDIETNKKMICAEKIHPHVGNPSHELEFKLLLMDVDIPEIYGHIIWLLGNLSNASLETGNPIHWS